MPITFVNSEAEDYYEKGLAFEASKAWKEAAENYDLAAQADSAHPEVWYRLGEAWAHRQNEKDCGCDGYLAAMACKATTADEYYWRAKATEARSRCIREDNDKGIAANYAASVALEPNNAEVWFSYAKVADSDELRLHCYNQALTLDPTNTLYQHNRAASYQRIGRFDEALADYNVVLAHEPQNADCYYGRGQLYQEHDHLVEALADYNSSLAIENSEYSEYRAKARGKLRLLAHDFKGALKDFGFTKRPFHNWREDKADIEYPALGKQTADVRWEEAVQALERSGLLEMTHPDYLQGRCEYYLGLDSTNFVRDGSMTPTEEMEAIGRKIMPEAAQLALDDAEVLVGLKPEIPCYRELRIACLLAMPEPDFAALDADYGYVLQHTLWSAKPTKQRRLAKSAPPRAGHVRVEYLHRYAWAQFNTGNHAGALASFAEAVADPSAGEKVDGICLPPSPAEAYILWQLRQQLPKNLTSSSTDLRIKAWMEMAIRSGELTTKVSEALRLAFEKYWFVYIEAGFYFTYPRTAEDYSVALAACATAAEQVPAIADIFGLMSLNILKGQLRQAKNQKGATEASTEAALAHYDTARAEMLAKWQG
jgi:tetratricopeptide (TPR) repeat protein